MKLDKLPREVNKEMSGKWKLDFRSFSTETVLYRKVIFKLNIEMRCDIVYQS